MASSRKGALAKSSTHRASGPVQPLAARQGSVTVSRISGRAGTVKPFTC
jgi:hypothetical protein